MDSQDAIALAFRRVRHDLSKKKKQLLKDIEYQIEEDADVRDIVDDISKSQWDRYVAVSCDRRRNDNLFSYSDFDTALVLLDNIAGGTGIYKPANQLRALRWGGRRRDLLKVLCYLASHNSQLDFRRALVVPFPRPVVGHRIDPKVYLR